MFQGDKLLMDFTFSHLRSESFSTASFKKKKKKDIEYSHLQSLLWPTAAEANFTIYHSQALSRILRCSPICVLEDQGTSRELASPMKLPLTQNQRKYYRQTSGHCCLTHFDYVQEVKYFFQYVPSQKYWNEICGILWSRIMQGNQQILLWQCSVCHEINMKMFI